MAQSKYIDRLLFLVTLEMMINENTFEYKNMYMYIAIEFNILVGIKYDFTCSINIWYYSMHSVKSVLLQKARMYNTLICIALCKVLKTINFTQTSQENRC